MYIANTPYLFIFLPKGKRQCIRRVTRFFFDQLETHRIELIFLYFCKLIKTRSRNGVKNHTFPASKIFHERITSTIMNF